MTKILNHISFARDWLNKAENRIRDGDLTNGELFLSLAEAEIRKAWENSLLSREEEKGIKSSSNFKKILITALAVMVLVMGFTYLNLKGPFTESEQIKLTLSDYQEERMDLHKRAEPRLIDVDLILNREEIGYETSFDN